MTTRSFKVTSQHQPPPGQVQAFNQDGGSPPTFENIAINWQSSLKTSPWNQEVICLLAIDFQAKIRSGGHLAVTFDLQCMSVDALS